LWKSSVRDFKNSDLQYINTGKLSNTSFGILHWNHNHSEASHWYFLYRVVIGCTCRNSFTSLRKVWFSLCRLSGNSPLPNKSSKRIPIPNFVRDSTVVKVLCYKSEGRWFDPSWCLWIFHWHKILPIALW